MILLLVFALEAASSPPKQSQQQVVEFAGYAYRFPADSFVYATKFGSDAVEVGVSFGFYAEILGKVAPVTGWQSWNIGGTKMVYITRPNEIFQWTPNANSLKPPVSEKTTFLSTKNGMNFWSSNGVYGANELIYITYENDPNIYVECDKISFGDWRRACELSWYHENAIHRLGIAGDWIERAPAVAAEYRKVVLAD
jgi:hypothetical protein